MSPATIARSSPTWAELARTAIKIASRAYNAFRLIGRPGHHRNIASAHRVLAKVKAIHAQGVDEGAQARIFGYLRKVHPHVFEELVLTAAQEAGHFIVRNRRYTGDGGEDGRFYEVGRGWVLVQCKRYQAHVCAQHVQEFAELVRRTGCARGIFVHTGRTGALSWSQVRGNGPVRIVSGNRLIAMLLHGQAG